jgi:hypothetical protein
VILKVVLTTTTLLPNNENFVNTINSIVAQQNNILQMLVENNKKLLEEIKNFLVPNAGVVVVPIPKPKAKKQPKTVTLEQRDREVDEIKKKLVDILVIEQKVKDKIALTDEEKSLKRSKSRLKKKLDFLLTDDAVTNYPMLYFNQLEESQHIPVAKPSVGGGGKKNNRK